MVTNNLKKRRLASEGRRGRPRVFLDNLMAVGLPLFVMVFAFTIAVGARQVHKSPWAKGGHGERRLMRDASSPWASHIVMPAETGVRGAPAFDNGGRTAQEQQSFPSSSSSSSSSSSGSMMNGTDTETVQPGNLKLEECEMSYGVLPCSTNVVGNVFLMWAFGSILLTAARFISEGSELLLEVVNPGLIGGLLLPSLGALPDALLIMVSGLGGDKAKAQEEVVVGIGVLAGSTIMMLTVAWAGSIICGRCDLTGPKGEAVDNKLTLGWDCTKTGVTTDDDTRIGAGVMMLTILPYIAVQIPLIDRHTEEGPTAALIGLVLAWAGLVFYFIYQVANPILQKKKIQQARLDLVHHEFIRDMAAAANTFGGLLHADAKPNLEAIEKLFDKADTDGNGSLNAIEVRAMLVGLAHDVDERASHIFQAMDLDSDKRITKAEFVPSLAQFLEKKRKADRESAIHHMHRQEFWEAEAERQRLVYTELIEMVEEEDEEPEHEEKKMTPGQIYFWAVFYMLIGAGLAAVFADPVVSSVTGFSKTSGIPAFFVAFVVTPMASNSSELVSSLIFAMKKKKRCMSLTLSQVYGAISMNNTLCLGIFLTVVYARGLLWEFSSESVIILFAILTMGSLGYSRRTFQLWTIFPVLCLYPSSLLIVYVLDTYLGWK